MITDIQGTIKSINNLYYQLSTLSNDELRQRFSNLREQIASQNISLDEGLVNVFSIVKETMRRFASSKGIIVVANEMDKKLAAKYDYVRIEEDKAIYLNSWKAGGEAFTWNMIPYDVQLHGGIEIHNGKIIQMATGEGKTLVVVAPAILNAMVGKNVHVMTTNDYLSKRDFEITSPIYSLLGISVGCVVGFKKYGRKRKDAYCCNITYGSISDFVFDYLFDHLAKDFGKCVQTKHDFCIIDEVDSILIDEAQTPHIVSDYNEKNHDEQNLYAKYLPIVELFVKSDEDFFCIDNLRKSVKITEAGKKWLSEKCGDTFLYDESHYKDMVHKIESNTNISKHQQKGLIEAEKNIYYSQRNLQNVLYQLLKAITLFHKDIDYIVKDNKVVIIDYNTGRPKYNSVWEFGLHDAVMAKEKVEMPIYNDFIHSTISMKNYISMYDKISGMTGTAISAKEEFKQVYKLDVANIPPNKPVIRKDLPLRVFRAKKDLQKALLEEIKKLNTCHRPIIIGVNTIRESDKIGELLKTSGYEAMLLNAKTLMEEANIISRAGMSDSIMVATSVAGRGTDIKPQDEVLQNGGLAIIGLGIAPSKRIDEQLSGRTARQGNPGSSQFFVSLEDEIIGYLSEEENKELFALPCDEKGEISSSRAIELFFKAQANEEYEDKQSRFDIMQRDDKIDSYRQFIYSTRMSLLKGDCNIERIMQKIIPCYNDSTFVSQCKLNEDKIKKISLPIMGQHLVDIYDIKKLSYVPLLYNNSIITIVCNFEEALKSNGETLIREMKKQFLLGMLDKYWVKFINEINTPLISITEYEQIYQKYHTQMVDEIKDFLLNTKVAAWSNNSNKDEVTYTKTILESVTKEDVLEPKDLN